MGVSYGVNIVNDGLVFSVDAGNKQSYVGSGTSWNDTMGGINFTLSGTPTYETANGGGLVFDGIDDFAQHANDPTFNSINEFTFNFWVKYGGEVDAVTLIGKPRAGWADALRIGYTLSTTTLFYSLSGTTRCKNTSVTLSTTEFTNICFVQNPSESAVLDRTKFYINGAVIGNESTGYALTSANAPTFPLILGGWRQGNSGVALEWDGNMNIAQMYNKALSASEVLKNYNAYKRRFGL